MKPNEKLGRKKKYDFSALQKIGDTFVILNGNVASLRCAGIQYSRNYQNGKWKFFVRKEKIDGKNHKVFVVREK